MSGKLTGQFADLFKLSLAQLQVLVHQQLGLGPGYRQHRKHPADGSQRHIHVAHVPDHARRRKLVRLIVTVPGLGVDVTRPVPVTVTESVPVTLPASGAGPSAGAASGAGASAAVASGAWPSAVPSAGSVS